MRFSFRPGVANEWGAGFHFAQVEDVDLHREYYTIRCVAYRDSDAQGYPIPGRWISDAYPDDGSLLESGLTVITVPNPCAR